MSVILTRGIRFADGDTVPGSYVWSFTVKVDDGSGSFVRVRDMRCIAIIRQGFWIRILQ